MQDVTKDIYTKQDVEDVIKSDFPRETVNGLINMGHIRPIEGTDRKQFSRDWFLRFLNYAERRKTVTDKIRLSKALKLSNPERVKTTLARPIRKVMGTVYLIQCNEFCKIGLAQDVSVRLSQIQMSNPYDVVLLHSFKSDDCIRHERLLHKKYSGKHHRGEWFKLTPGDIAEIMLIERMD